MFEGLKIITINFYCQFSLNTANGLLDIVGDRLRKVPDDTGNFREFTVHGGGQFIFVLMEDWPPLILGLEVNEVFGVEEAGRIGPIVGTANLTGDLGDLRERSEDHTCPVHNIDAVGWSLAGSERTAHPDSAFVEVRQELRTQNPTEYEIGGECKNTTCATYDHQAMTDSPIGCDAIVIGEPDENRVVPLLRILDEEKARKNGRQHQREQQRSE